jgi:uncharacterized protein YceK
MRKITTAFTAAITVILFSGCGTIITRSGALGLGSWDSGLPPVYQATVLDTKIAFGPSSEPVGQQAAQRLAFFIDLPISIAADTLLLPFDLLPESPQERPQMHDQSSKGAERLQTLRQR